MRSRFIRESLSTKKGLTHGIRQNENYIFDDVIQLYKDKAEELILEHPFRVQYTLMERL